MSDLIEFLTAHLDEDEQTALAASGPGARYSTWVTERWYNALEEPRVLLGQGTARQPVVMGMFTPTAVPAENGEHIARHDPARVLADVAAKRTIIEKITGWGHYYVDGDSWFSCGLADDGDGPGSGCADNDRRGTCDCRLEQRQNEYLALLALPYADHPDYDPGWRP